MMETEPGLATAAILVLRLIGSLGGALIALVIAPPSTLRGGLQRLTVSLASGMMLEPVLGTYLSWRISTDNIIASACIVSAIAWWLWHTLIRIVQSGSLFNGKNRQ